MIGNNDLHYPISHVLLDCQQAEQHTALLEHTVSRIQCLLEECELNFCTYQSKSELITKCIGITTEMCNSNRRSHPYQLIWIVDDSDAISLEDDSAVAILALFEAMRESSRFIYRSIIVHLNGLSNDAMAWPLLLDASLFHVDSIDEIQGCSWNIGSLHINSVRLNVHSDRPCNKLPIGQCCLLGVVADRTCIEPFFDGSVFARYLICLF